MNLGLCYSRIREDEKLLLDVLRERGHAVTKIDVRAHDWGIGRPPAVFERVDLAFNRCVESSRVRYVAELLAHYDVPVVNSPHTARVCP